jgi:nucleosome binding factor SPN SPT16 subunit
MADIKIDSKLFQDRLSHFATSWKNDLRSKESLFGGASSIIVMMGKMEEVPEFHKNNAVHVSHFNTTFGPWKVHVLESANIIMTVLAARIRIPDHTHAFHHRHPIHSHDSEKRCDFERDNQNFDLLTSV